MTTSQESFGLERKRKWLLSLSVVSTPHCSEILQKYSKCVKQQKLNVSFTEGASVLAAYCPTLIEEIDSGELKRKADYSKVLSKDQFRILKSLSKIASTYDLTPLK